MIPVTQGVALGYVRVGLSARIEREMFAVFNLLRRLGYVEFGLSARIGE